MSRIFISAAHKSSGKTTVSIGLCAALNQRGLNVQPFKKGPDYIDPMWLGYAAKRPCHNLDFYTMSRNEIRNTFICHDKDANISVIEGNKGLFDALDLDGSNSNAALAILLKTPVILVLDARGMTRGIAPLILGYQAFDKEVNIAGVILNQLGGQRHESKLRAVIEHYTDIQVLGALYRNDDLEIEERHLGLIPSNESEQAQARIDQLASAVSKQTDIEKIIQTANAVENLETNNNQNKSEPTILPPDVRIGIIKDAAFGFYYPGDLDSLRQAGAELIEINSINDNTLPDIDGLFIGGGFPETQMKALENNKQIRQAIYNAIENGLPCYAECGGLMYLAESIKWQDSQYKMVGSIPGTVLMHNKPQGRGYIQLKETADMPWPVAPIKDNVIYAHEFHYSSIEGLPEDTKFAYEVLRGAGINGKNDGLVYKNLLACYAHLRHTQQSPWTGGFVNFVRKCKSNRGTEK